MHFLSRDNTYAYVRYTDDEAVFVFVNGSDEPRAIPVERYGEVLDKFTKIGKDVISGHTIDLNMPTKVDGLTAIVVPMARK